MERLGDFLFVASGGILAQLLVEATPLLPSVLRIEEVAVGVVASFAQVGDTVRTDARREGPTLHAGSCVAKRKGFRRPCAEHEGEPLDHELRVAEPEVMGTGPRNAGPGDGAVESTTV